MGGRAKIHHTPSHTFPRHFMLFKSCCHRRRSVFIQAGGNHTMTGETQSVESFLRKSCEARSFLCNMFLLILVMPLLETALSSPLTTSLQKGCPPSNTRKPHPQPESSVPALALGDPCGVYTRSCAHSLRCQPSEDDTRPLHALLEGRGVCSNVSRAEPTQQTYSVDPSPGKEQNEAPCRELLTSLMRGLHAHLFHSHHDIYMPNCDKRGFFRKKQCWSSRGKWRGKCWCVDENGTPISADIRSSQSC